MHARTPALTVLLAALLASSCNSPPPPSAERAAPEPSAEERPLQTALLSVELRPDGGVRIHDVVPKPIAYRDSGVAFDPARHAPSQGSTAPGVGTPAGGGGLTVAPSPGPRGRPRGAIIVRHPSRDVPFVEELEWGAPGEGGGDVADRWDGGWVIWRAPYYGPGTRYSVVRTAPGPVALLAERRATP